jgi:hypothetical protein
MQLPLHKWRLERAGGRAVCCQSIARAIFAQRNANGDERRPARAPTLSGQRKIMNYLILFSTAAVAGIYLLIIWECLKHPEW